VGQEIEIMKCIPLFSEEYQEKRKVLFELLQAAGYDIPPMFLKDEEDREVVVKGA
jgi:hypothetical protein